MYRKVAGATGRCCNCDDALTLATAGGRRVLCTTLERARAWFALLYADVSRREHQIDVPRNFAELPRGVHATATD